MKRHQVSLNVCSGRPGGDAIHAFVAGAPWQVAALLPHLNQLNAMRGTGYYYVDFHSGSVVDCEQVEVDLASNWVAGRTTQWELGPRLAHPSLGYHCTPVVCLYDSPRATSRLVEQACKGGRHALGYLVVSQRQSLRFGLQFAVAPDDVAAQSELHALLGSLAMLGDRHGVEAVFGNRPGETEVESDLALFQEFALHLERNATSVLDQGKTATPAIQRVLGGRVTTVTKPESLVGSLTSTMALTSPTALLENAA